MNDTEYKKLISELCSVFGLGEWEEVARTEHIEINRRNIGLIRSSDPKTRMSRISVYIDLGPIQLHHSQKIHEKMLAANTTAGRTAAGCFAVHPLHQTAIYHIPNAERMSGIELAQAIALALTDVIPEFEKFSSPHSDARTGPGLGPDRRQSLTFTQSAK